MCKPDIPEKVRRRNSNKYWLFISLTIIWMALIFLNSAMTGKVSSGFSETIVRVLLNISEWFKDSGMAVRLREFLQGGFFHLLIRKTAHFIEFGILGLLLFSSLGIFVKIRNRLPLRALLASAFSIIYAVTDEVHQLFVPGRVCSAVDVIIDSAGAVVFSGFVAYVIWIKRKGTAIERK